LKKLLQCEKAFKVTS